MAEQGKQAEWTDAYVDELPDSAFLYVDTRGHKDATGKTMPRTCRHFAYRDKEGAIDWPHLERAIDRIPKSAAPGLTPAKKAALVEQAQKLREEGPKEEEEAAEEEPGFLTRCVNTVRQTPPKQLVLVAGLVIVILIALGFAVSFSLKQTGVVTTKATPPDYVLNMQITKISEKAPYNEVTLMYREWEKLGSDNVGRYKDPKTKEYTMVSPIPCAACGKDIPMLTIPPEVYINEPEKRDEKILRLQSEYICPLCGQPAYPREGR